MRQTFDNMLASINEARNLKPVLQQNMADRVSMLNDRAGFLHVTEALGNLATPRQYSVMGYGIVYRRNGSAAGGRLTVAFGAELRDIKPGDSLEGPFREFSLVRSSTSAVVGNIELVVLKRPDVSYLENETFVETSSASDLLGDVATPTWVSVSENTQPSGAAPTGSFLVNGVKRIRVLIDGAAANTLTSTDLIPWYYDSTLALWFEQGTERVGVPDSAATAYRYRVVTLPVTGGGRMFLEIRNLLPAAATALSFIVQGIE